MTRPPRIACIGELLVEFVATDKNGRHRRPGTYAGPFPSGAPGIFIDQAARAGGDCIFVGSVGDDAFGAVILERLNEAGVDVSLIREIKGAPTGSAFVSYNDDASRDFVFNIAHSAAARFEMDDATLVALSAFKLDVLHVSGSALGDAAMREKILRAAKALHAQGVKISFDPNIRKELVSDQGYFGAVRQLMDIAASFLPSDDDAAELFPGKKLAQFAPELFAKGADYVVLKKGAQGCEGLSRAGESASLKAHTVEAIDPTGAGDCFCATFVTLITSGMHDFPNALTRANAAGALAVGRTGPMEGNSRPAAFEALLSVRA
jgi:sugar/nucleoside kinase (ribokinase family)